VIRDSTASACIIALLNHLVASGIQRFVPVLIRNVA
jgi:hypothetical protein